MGLYVQRNPSREYIRYIEDRLAEGYTEDEADEAWEAHKRGTAAWKRGMRRRGSMAEAADTWRSAKRNPADSHDAYWKFFRQKRALKKPWSRKRINAAWKRKKQEAAKRPKRKAKARRKAPSTPYWDYFRAKRALKHPWSPEAIQRSWRKKKAAALREEDLRRRSAVYAYQDIEEAAGEVFEVYRDTFGREYDPFYPYEMMFDVDEEKNTIQVVLDRSRDTKTKKGWSALDADNPEFIARLRRIRDKYRRKGLKMTIRVRNNPSHPRRRASRRRR